MKFSVHTFIFLLWMLVNLTASVYVAMSFDENEKLNINANIVAMLPKLDATTDLSELVDRNQYELIATVSSKDKQQVITASRALIESLESKKLRLALKESKFDSLYKSYQLNPLVLMEQEQLRVLQSRPEQFFARKLANLYQPVAPLITSSNYDPLFQLNDFLQNLKRWGSSMELSEQLLVGQAEDSFYSLLQWQLAFSPYEMEAGAAFVERWEAVIKSISEEYGVDVHFAGVIFHSASAAKQAKFEVSLIGSLSVLVICLLSVLLFRGLKPLFFTLSTVSIAVYSGFVICYWVFGEIYVLTLVFSSTLIGVGVDYCYHFIAHRYYAADLKQEPMQARRVSKAIFWSFFTTVMGYIVISLTEFHGLLQMVVFTIAGLTTCVVFVLFLGEMLFAHQHQRSIPALAKRLINTLHRASPSLFKFWPFLLALAILFTSLGFHADDDVALLKSSDNALENQQLFIQQITGGEVDSRELRVLAESPELLLQKLESLKVTLEQFKKESVMSEYFSLADYLPSQAYQREVLTRLAQVRKESLNSFFELSGTSSAEFDRQLELAKNNLLSAESIDFHENAFLRQMSIESVDGFFVSRILFYNLQNWETLANLAAADDQLVFYAPKQQLGEAFGAVRAELTYWLIIGLAVILLLLFWVFGFSKGLKIFMLPLFALVVVFGVLSGTGVSMNVFHSLAMLLVVGISIDYGIFIHELPDDATLLALIVSSLTTLVAFGVLGVSSTPAVQSFGTTVTIGIFASMFSVIAFLSLAKVSLSSKGKIAS